MSRELRRWCAAIVTVFTVSGLGLASYLARTPHVRDALHASTSQMSLLVVTLGCGSMLGLLTAPRVEGRLGSRLSMRWFAVVTQLGLVLAGAGAEAGSGPLLAVGLFVFGIGSGIVDVVMNVAAAAAERELGRTVLPIFHATFSLGTLAGAGIGALCEARDVSMAYHLGGIAVLNVAAVLMTNRWVPTATPADGAASSDAPAPSRPVSEWRDRATLLIGAVVLGMALAEGSANDWLALTMVDGHGVSNTAGGVALGVFLAALTVMRLFGVRLVDRYGRVPILRLCAVLAFVGLSLMIFVDDATVAFVGVALWGAGASLGFPLGMSAASDDPARAAARVSVVSTIGYIAFLVAPPVLGFLGDHWGLRTALIAVLVGIACAGLLSKALREPKDTTGRRAMVER